MTPWSVSPRAGWPYAAARSASLSILHAPSSSEYSEWTCRCATVGELIGEATICVASDVNFRVPAFCGDQNAADGHLLVARRAPCRQRVRDLHRPRRIGARRRGARGGGRGG